MYQPHPSDAKDLELSLGHHDYFGMIKSKYVEHALLKGECLASATFKKIVPSGFSLVSWAEAQNTQFVFQSSSDGMLIFPWGHVSFFTRGKNIIFNSLFDSPKAYANWVVFQEKFNFLEEGVTITWIHGPDWNRVQMEEVQVEPVNAIESAYPWLEGSIEQYAEKYMDSSASILILLGPPGTGKTSFIRSLLQHKKMKAAITYEPRLLCEDGLFAYFISDDDTDTLILEDADNYLGSRKDGNDMMHRFLNVSNGLISPLKGKKIIFTTNLPSTQDIDAALMRPGRCYEVMQFRALDRAEAQAVAGEIYGDDAPELNEKSYTLAEITNLNRVEKTKSKKSFGFLT